MDEEERGKNLYGDEESLDETFINMLKSYNENESDNNLTNNDISFNLDLPAILRDNKDSNDYRCNECLFFPYIEINDKNTMNFICKCTDFKKKQISIKEFINNIKNLQNKKNGNIFQLKCYKHKEEFRYYCTKCRRNI